MIVRAEIEHADKLACNLPGFDEYWKLVGMTEKQAILLDITRSVESWTWLTPEVGAIFGVNYHNMVEAPFFWIYPSKIVEEKPLSFARAAKMMQPYFTSKYPELSGYCNMLDEKYKRFIEWMGGTIKEKEKINGMDLRRFYVNNWE